MNHAHLDHLYGNGPGARRKPLFQVRFLLDSGKMASTYVSCRAACVYFVIASCFTGCSTRAGEVVIRPVPGTEQVCIEEFCITVSPDERWLTFVEWKFPRATLRKQLPPGEYHTRVVSLGLDSGVRTEHTIESIPRKALGLSGDELWKYRAGFSLIKERFRPPGWRGEYFYFQHYYGGTYVAFDPSKPEIEIAAEPDAPGTCSDCPPMISAQFRDHSWDLLSNEITVVVHEGAVGAVYYVSSPYQLQQGDDIAVYRITDAGKEEVVLEVPERGGVHVIIGSVRVSPNERFLAYTVDSKKQAFMSAPREVLFIRELATGREKRIAEYEDVGNLIWSPGGSRLYFAGGEYSSDTAVYIVDVGATFAQ